MSDLKDLLVPENYGKKFLIKLVSGTTITGIISCDLPDEPLEFFDLENNSFDSPSIKLADIKEVIQEIVVQEFVKVENPYKDSYGTGLKIGDIVGCIKEENGRPTVTSGVIERRYSENGIYYIDVNNGVMQTYIAEAVMYLG